MVVEVVISVELEWSLFYFFTRVCNDTLAFETKSRTVSCGYDVGRHRNPGYSINVASVVFGLSLQSSTLRTPGHKSFGAKYLSKLHTKRNHKSHSLTSKQYHLPAATYKLTQCPIPRSPPSTSSAPPSSTPPTARIHLRPPPRHPLKLEMPAGKKPPMSTGSSASPLTMRWRTSCEMRRGRRSGVGGGESRDNAWRK